MRIYVHVADVSVLTSGHFQHGGFAAKKLPDGTYLCALDAGDAQILRHIIQTEHLEKFISILPTVRSGKQPHHHVTAQVSEHIKDKPEIHAKLKAVAEHNTGHLLDALYEHTPEAFWLSDHAD